jgi:hypothetical protein
MYRLGGAAMEQVGLEKSEGGTDSQLSCSVIPLGYAARVRQRSKIEEIGAALARAGYTSLDAQARVLGLSRSTAWTLLTGVHKSSGLSASTVNKILSTSRLPREVQRKLVEYLADKVSGLYGDRPHRLKAFKDKIDLAHLEAALREVSRRDS